MIQVRSVFPLLQGMSELTDNFIEGIGNKLCIRGKYQEIL